MMYKDAKDVGGALQCRYAAKLQGSSAMLSHDDKAIQAREMSHASSPSSPRSPHLTMSDGQPGYLQCIMTA
jgi:hypothetical protein